MLQYAEERPPIPQIGEALGVNTIMECSVRYNDDQVILTAQLIDAMTDEHIWSNTYTGDMTNLQSLFEIQASIAMNVADALRLEFFAEALERIERPPTESRIAYEHYLLASSLLRRNTPNETREAVEELEQAIALDPKFGLAHIALGQAYGSVWTPAIPEITERRERAILDAVQFAPDQPGTQLLLAGRFERAWQWAEADEAYRKAMELSPDGFDTNRNYGNFLRMTGRMREAVPHFEAAQIADPLVLNPELNLSQAYDALGEHEQSVIHYERTKSLLGVRSLPEGQHVYSLVGVGELGEAKRHWASLEPRYAEMGPPTTRLFGTAIELLEDPPTARAALLALRDDYPIYSSGPLSSHFANWAAYFEDAESAIGAIRQSVRTSTVPFVYLWLPIWQKVRPEPEFKEFIRETGLVGYWRQYGWPEHCRPLGEADFECS